MTPWQRELQARWFKASNMRMKKIIEKGKQLLSYISGKVMLKILTGEASKGYKKKK